MLLGYVNCFNGFGQRTDLIGFYDRGVGHFHVNALFYPLRIGCINIIADYLHMVSQQLCHFLKSIPIIVCQTIFN